MHLEEFTARIQAGLQNQNKIDPDMSLGEMGYDSLNVTELILICAELFPNFDFNEKFIFFENTSLREIYTQLTLDHPSVQ